VVARLRLATKSICFGKKAFVLAHALDDQTDSVTRLKKKKKNFKNLFFFLLQNRRIDHDAIDVCDASASTTSSTATHALRIAVAGCQWRDAAIVRAGATSLLLCALEAHSSAIHVFLLPMLSNVDRRRSRLAGPPVPTGGATCLQVASDDGGDMLVVGLTSGGARCIRFGVDGTALLSFDLQAASVVARLIGGLVPNLIGSRSASAVLSMAVIAPRSDADDTFVVGACADWQLRVWSVARRECVLALPLTPETRDGGAVGDAVFESADGNAPQLVVRFDDASRRVVVLLGGRDVAPQVQLFALAFADDGRPQLAVQTVFFVPIHGKTALVDVLALQCRVWLMCVDATEPILMCAALPPVDSDVVELGNWLLAAAPARVPFERAAGDDDATSARHFATAFGNDSAEQALSQCGVPSSARSGESVVARLCAGVRAMATSASAAGTGDASAFAWQRLAKLATLARARAEQPLALAALGNVPVVVGAHAVAVVRDSSVPEQLLAQSRGRLPSPLTPMPCVYVSSDGGSAHVDADTRQALAPTYRSDVALLLRCMHQARAKLGEAAFAAYQSSVLSGNDLDQAAYEHVAALLCSSHGAGSHFVEWTAALPDPIAAIDAVLNTLERFDALADDPALADDQQGDTFDARKAWLVRASNSQVALDAAAQAARNAARAALDLSLALLLVVFSVLRRVGAARAPPHVVRELRGASLTRVKRVVNAAALVAGALLPLAAPRVAGASSVAVGVDEPDASSTLASVSADSNPGSVAAVLASQIHERLCARVARSAALGVALDAGSSSAGVSVAPLLGRALTLSCRHVGATSLALLAAQQHETVLLYAPLALRLAVGEPIVRHCAALAALALGRCDADVAAAELEAVGPSLTRQDALLLVGGAPPLAGLDDAAANLDSGSLQDARLLASYYMHVLAVLESKRLLPQAARFAELALPYARLVDVRAAASLRASAFRLHLARGAFEAAYRAMLPHVYSGALQAADGDASVRDGTALVQPIEERLGDESAAASDERWRTDALRRLVVVLCEQRALTTLCELPFVGMVDQVRQLLLTKAQHSPLKVKPDYYSILYAFSVYRGDHRRAAIAMYECATRLASESSGADGIADLQRRLDALDATLTALRLVEPQSRWLPRVRTLPHQSPKRTLNSDEVNVRGGPDDSSERTALDVVSLADLERERSLVAARIELVRSGTVQSAGGVGGDIGADDAVVLLCHMGDYARALSLARQCGADAAPIFDGLVQACATNRCAGLRVDDDMVDDTIGLPVTPQASAWRALRCCLAQYDGAPTAHAMYTRVAARLLAVDTRARLPHWLRSTLLRDNPAALLRVYLAFASSGSVALLNDACEAVQAILQRNANQWLPLNHIDSVLALLETSRDAGLRTWHDMLRDSLRDVVSGGDGKCL
jgi:hypothetical protein